jgi:hypothetical protein
MSTFLAPVAEEHGEDSKRKTTTFGPAVPAFYFGRRSGCWFQERLAFPALSVEFGALFIPYFLAFFIIGVPILSSRSVSASSG